MIRISKRITICAMAALMTFSGWNLNAAAAGASSVLPSSGVNITLSKGTTLESLQQETGDTTARVEAILDRVAIEEARKAAGLEEAAREEEELKQLVMDLDPDAFIILQEAHQVLGEGFKRYSKNEL